MWEHGATTQEVAQAHVALIVRGELEELREET